ncbi:MAG: hypothetical protein IJS02_03140 [Bacteroidales bacterium]|nr:hypothetical protein [Bacteroidales bacterium]
MKQTIRYSTNSSAESILDFTLSFLRIIGILFSAVLIVIGILSLTGESFFDDYAIPIGILFIVLGGLNIICTLLNWALGKLWINMSRNLFNINDKLESIVDAMPKDSIADYLSKD